MFQVIQGLCINLNEIPLYYYCKQTSKPVYLSNGQVRNKLRNKIREISGLVSKGGVMLFELRSQKGGGELGSFCVETWTSDLL